ncbi:MAG: tyrosine--tRNA ligase, partial [Mycoplasmataceae bacterium]|nr:tyrosine--tRNA ligase [Mycoplasmataceae bacterium]
MKIKNLKKDLYWRGLLKDIANENSLVNIVEEEGSFYIGIDPTSDSIHVGHFMTLNLAKILNNHGLKPILVLGGFTGMIGDPSGRNSERDIVSFQDIEKNSNMIEKQIIKLANKMGIVNFSTFNNIKIYESMSIIELYQKFGKLFNVNTMLSKESVKNRINNGISYTEFSYQMFQAIDFLYLYENKNAKLQLGGSDQWGNITAGTELIRKIHGNEVDVSGITINLLTDENGNKIGKTQGTPMWLDKTKTSSYELFQYFFNQSDITSSKLLVQLTNITEIEYNQIKKNHELSPKNRVLQNEVAKRFITIVHSKKDYEKAVKLS